MIPSISSRSAAVRSTTANAPHRRAVFMHRAASRCPRGDCTTTVGGGLASRASKSRIRVPDSSASTGSAPSSIGRVRSTTAMWIGTVRIARSAARADWARTAETPSGSSSAGSRSAHESGLQRGAVSSSVSRSPGPLAAPGEAGPSPPPANGPDAGARCSGRGRANHIVTGRKASPMPDREPSTTPGPACAGHPPDVRSPAVPSD